MGNQLCWTAYQDNDVWGQPGAGCQHALDLLATRQASDVCMVPELLLDTQVSQVLCNVHLCNSNT